MPIHAINVALQIACITLLAFTGILLVRYAHRGLNTWTGISLVVAVTCYLVLETSFVQETRPLFIITVTGSMNIPVIFFLLTKAIFDDHFKPSWRIALWIGLNTGAHFWVYLCGMMSTGSLTDQVFHLTAEIVALGFVLAGIYTAIRTRKADLIESRMKFRNVFISFTAALIGVTLIVESLPIVRASVDTLQSLQRTSILAITGFFLIRNFEIKQGFFFKDLPREKPVVIEDSALRKKLEQVIDVEKIYRKEGLTIGGLSEMLGEQEYKVRRMINGELGFKNFNDFLNKYRVQEACTILSDPTQSRKTILEIAYSLGYQSIGPFNKAFKDLKGTTPTSFRKGV